MSVELPERLSDIQRFWLQNPSATEEEIHAFTGEATKRLCECGLLMRRFECWNGMCESCRRDKHPTGGRECGCMAPGGGFWFERGGWHYADSEKNQAVERCPKYWPDRDREREVDIVKTVDGMKQKSKAKVELYPDVDDRRKLRARYLDADGREISRKRKEPAW